MEKFEFEYDFEVVSEQVENTVVEKHIIEEKIKSINESAKAVLNDNAIKKLLADAKNEESKKLDLLESENRNLLKKIKEWKGEVLEANNMNLCTYEVIQELKFNGFDVSKAEEICTDRQNKIYENLVLINDILKLFGEESESSDFKVKVLNKRRVK